MGGSCAPAKLTLMDASAKKLPSVGGEAKA
jgi:hypothetical protein